MKIFSLATKKHVVGWSSVVVGLIFDIFALGLPGCGFSTAPVSPYEGMWLEGVWLCRWGAPWNVSSAVVFSPYIFFAFIFNYLFWIIVAWIILSLVSWIILSLVRWMKRKA